MEPRSDEVISESLPGPAAEAAQADREGYLLTTALAQRIDLIRHLIDFSRQIIMIVGDEGGGKTSLLHHLLTTAAGNWRVAKVNADPMCDHEALLKRLAADFELRFSDNEDRDRRVVEFEHFIAANRRAALVPVVLVDDAHLLPADALLLLQRLAQADNESPNLRVALFCDSRITRVLGSPQLHSFRDSLTHTVELAAFTLEDTARYLAAHWPAADPESSPILDERYVREVHAAAAGIPGRINALVRTSLEAPGGTPEEQMPQPSGRQMGMLVAGLGVAALLTAGVWLAMPEQGEGPAPAETGSPTLAANAPTPIVEPVAIPQQETALPAAAPPVITPPAISPAPPSPANTVESFTSPTQAVSESNGANGSGYSQTPEQSVATPVAPVTPTPPPLATAPAPPPPAISAPKPAEKPKPVKPAADKAAASPWLQRQPSGNYVVQLYATYQRPSATQFIAEHDLGGKANVLATLRDNKTWYVVVYGSYGDRARARAAIDGLPGAVQRLNPWVRKVADLKALQADR